MRILHQVFATILGLWVAFTLNVSEASLSYYWYSAFVVVVSAILVIWLSLAFSSRRRSAPRRWLTYAGIQAVAILVTVSLLYMGEHLLDPKARVDTARTALLPIVFLAWILCAEARRSLAGAPGDGRPMRGYD